jgi:hypothetical protein
LRDSGVVEVHRIFSELAVEEFAFVKDHSILAAANLVFGIEPEEVVLVSK